MTLPNLAYMYDDIAPIRLMLEQTSAKADANGVMSGNCPSGGGIADYALIWFESLRVYLFATGDAACAKALYPRAERCMDYFMGSKCYTVKGFSPPGLGCVVDWGYSKDEAPSIPVNICLNALLVTALQAMVAIAASLQDSASAAKYGAALAKHTALVKKYVGGGAAADARQDQDGWIVVEPEQKVETPSGTTMDSMRVIPHEPTAAASAPEPLHSSAPFDPSKLGFHGAAFVLRAGLLDSSPADVAACAAYIKVCLRAKFPINKAAPRLSDPSKRSSDGFYTPYFQTFTFEGLFKAGEADFCVKQYEQAWGWALTQASTWVEVFDPRWEVVHSWGGCPTWQLSQFALGLSPRFDVGARHFELALHVGTVLDGVKGSVPSRHGAAVGVAWSRAAGGAKLTLTLGADEAYVMGWPTSPTAWVKLSGTVSANVKDIA